MHRKFDTDSKKCQNLSTNVMVTNLYFFIIFIHAIKSKSLHHETVKSAEHMKALQLLNLLKPSELDSNEVRSILKNEAKYFESVVESATGKTSKQPIITEKYHNPNPKNDKNYRDVKVLLSKLLEQLMEIEKEKRDDKPNKSTEKEHGSSERSHFSSSNKIKKKKKEENKHIRWGHWTDWSSCSVSCGKGRQIRWRHCIEHCEDAETEMEEKSCQLPACGPGKLFGVIKL